MSYKQIMHINVEQQLKEEIENWVEVQKNKGVSTNISEFIRLACLEKLGIIKHSDLLPVKEMKEDPELNESDEYDQKTMHTV